MAQDLGHGFRVAWHPAKSLTPSAGTGESVRQQQVKLFTSPANIKTAQYLAAFLSQASNQLNYVYLL